MSGHGSASVLSGRGSASVLSVGLAAVCVLLTAVTGTVGYAAARHVALDTAADAAALAAADALAGFVSGDACAFAGRTAELEEVRLVSCSVDGAVVDVVVSTSVLGFTATSRARAGPAE
jgi:secretion/DNA translocation related TadE-like protein